MAGLGGEAGGHGGKQHKVGHEGDFSTAADSDPSFQGNTSNMKEMIHMMAVNDYAK